MEENLPLLDIEFFTDLLDVPYTQIHGQSAAQTQKLQDISDIEPIIVCIDGDTSDPTERLPPNPSDSSAGRGFRREFESLFEKFSGAPPPTQSCGPQQDDVRESIKGEDISTLNFVFEPISGIIENGFIETQYCYVTETVKDVIGNMCDSVARYQQHNPQSLIPEKISVDTKDPTTKEQIVKPTKKAADTLHLNSEGKASIQSAEKDSEKHKSSIIRKRKIVHLQDSNSPKMDITSVNVAPKCVRFLFNGAKCLHKGLSKRQSVKRLHVSFRAETCRKYVNAGSDNDENEENVCADYDSEE